MKKYAFMLITALLFLYACSDKDDNEANYKTYPVSVQLVYPPASEWNAIAGVPVKLTDSNGSTYSATTTAEGKATFAVPAGIYEASATDKRAVEGYAFVLNGINSNIIITELWTGEDAVAVELKESKAGQVIIKELYVGGCQKDDGSGAFYLDKYAILYNNSDQVASLENLCFGMALPQNSNVANKNYGPDGKLTYEAEGFIPAGYAIWYFQHTLTIQPYQQIVVALNGAIDHTQTYSKSVNLANSSYYCFYDIDDYNNTSHYPAPSDKISSSHYLLARSYGLGNAWPISQTGPTFFMFTVEGTTPAEFAGDENNYWQSGGTAGNAYRCVKVPVEWILDGIEVYTEADVAQSKKRLTSTIDAGYTLLTNAHGHTSYRNVDKAATEALAENKGKLVYGYSKGTEGSSDPSSIDAEASIKNGAHLIYQDTNNSTHDFHQRSQSSLRD